MAEKCYLCNLPFDNEKVVKHGEHIIQDSLGGTLIANEILCACCGSKLGEKVDGPFVAALAPLTVLLDLPRGAGNHARAEARLIPNENEAASLGEVTFSLLNDFSVVPSRPLMVISESKETVTVIGSTLKQAEQYSKSPAVKAAVSSGYALKLCTNAAPYAQSLLLPVSPGSMDVLRGVLKIAIDFANNSEVPREVFEHLLADRDMTNSETLLRSSVFPYYPTTDAERFFETEKHTHEDWFPTHHLYIFNHNRNLYCYVELFGTIQNYVLLSAEYDGPPLEAKFVQKAERWIFNEDTFTARDPKDLHILAGEFEVDMRDKSWEKIQAEILQLAAIRQYSLEPELTIEKVRTLMLNIALYSRIKTPERFEVVKQVFEKAEIAKTQLGLSILDELRADPMIALPLLRYPFEDFKLRNGNESCPAQAREVPIEKLEKYTAYKFYSLLRAKSQEGMMKYEVIRE